MEKFIINSERMSLLTYDDVVKEGYVQFKKMVYVGIWRRYWIYLRKASSLGPARLEIIRNKKLETDSLHCSIEMDTISCIDASSEDKKCLLALTSGNSKYFLNFDTYAEMEEWCNLIYAFSSDNQDKSKNVFHVYILNNPVLPFYGECSMNISERSIILTEADNQDKLLMAWPLVSLRRFSSDDTKFMFETGRSCKTGEGLFVFNTKEGALISEMIKQVSQELAQERPNSFVNIPRPPLPPRPASRKCRSQSASMSKVNLEQRV